MENDKTPTPRPDTETRPGEIRTEALEGESRSMTQALASSYLDGAAKTLGGATVVAALHGAAKVKDALTSKDEGPKVIIPPGVKSDE